MNRGNLISWSPRIHDKHEIYFPKAFFPYGIILKSQFTFKKLTLNTEPSGYFMVPEKMCSINTYYMYIKLHLLHSFYRPPTHQRTQYRHYYNVLQFLVSVSYLIASCTDQLHNRNINSSVVLVQCVKLTIFFSIWKY